MKKQQVLIFFFSCLFLLFNDCMAEEKGFGILGLESLGFQLGSRPIALGGAYVGLSDSIDAVSYNPAGLAVLKKPEIAFMHNEWLLGTRYEYLGFAMPMGEANTLGLNLMYFYSGVDTRDIISQETGSITVSDIVAMLGYAVQYAEGLYWGCTIKYANENFVYLKKSAWLISLGLLYGSPETPFSMGITGENIYISKSSNCEAIPYTVKFGVTYKMLERESCFGEKREKYYLTWLADCILMEDSHLYYAGGAEFALPFEDTDIRLRAGINNIGKVINIAGGLGIAIGQFTIDYVTTINELGLTHHPQLSYRFD